MILDSGRPFAGAAAHVYSASRETPMIHGTRPCLRQLSVLPPSPSRFASASPLLPLPLPPPVSPCPLSSRPSRPLRLSAMTLFTHTLHHPLAYCSSFPRSSPAVYPASFAITYRERYCRCNTETQRLTRKAHNLHPPTHDIANSTDTTLTRKAPPHVVYQNHSSTVSVHPRERSTARYQPLQNCTTGTLLLLCRRAIFHPNNPTTRSPSRAWCSPGRMHLWLHYLEPAQVYEHPHDKDLRFVHTHDRITVCSIGRFEFRVGL
ncbi:hypothetical protein BJV74DRAFT_954293 [Russula compacta]|nr:hypothetical protein BJV74DRAFT_954293 [Russula compacta]